MATFIFKKSTTVVVTPEVQQVIISANGPQVVRTPAKVVKFNAGVVEVQDTDVIERIRRDHDFNTENISEVTQEDKEAIEIREKKLKEADEEIKTKKTKKVYK